VAQQGCVLQLAVAAGCLADTPGDRSGDLGVIPVTPTGKVALTAENAVLTAGCMSCSCLRQSQQHVEQHVAGQQSGLPSIEGAQEAVGTVTKEFDTHVLSVVALAATKAGGARKRTGKKNVAIIHPDTKSIAKRNSGKAAQGACPEQAGEEVTKAVS
jgi:hypothetical protein